MASLCPGTYIGVFRASTEAAPPATTSSIIIMAIITYTKAITSITYRCLTTTTGTTRATKAATTPSPHSADSGIVCLELGRQGDIQELQTREDRQMAAAQEKWSLEK